MSINNTTAAPWHACGPLCCPPRRGFLATAVGVGAALAMPGILHAAPMAEAPAIAANKVVDVHHHFVPPEYLKLAHDILAQTGVFHFPPYAHWTPATTLAQMDRFHVGTAIISISTPGIWVGDAARSAHIARVCNEYGTKMKQDHPGRFGLFAALPLPDPDGSLKEIAYALDTLHAEGIGLMTSYGNSYLGDRAYWPVYEELNRRGAMVFAHPSNPLCCTKIGDDVDPSMIEFPTDTTRCIVSLLYSGTIEKFPRIRWVFCHSGGTLPVLMPRIMQLGHSPMAAKKLPPERIPGLVRQFYFDVANAANPAAFSALRTVADPQRIFFGSDYPYVPVGATESGLIKLDLPAPLVEAILRGNALREMPSLAQS